ncbi:hypothetical protein C2869_08545 [Saccharobesus litoralis]|uniref:Tetrapyrrole biosynthesis uroporphyrinogen III synthase domain-containing protein n=1 Tax=Saccharobesus litoralis TaxID=2172099 RepID=A0A2S0VQH5_9ALTE|nr:uroporphyrinogen-III synthase [Saccharobesus litoralis]AWB66473.1 hypothetical protein C2869_08545 [Saccharobesus litoralis]
MATKLLSVFNPRFGSKGQALHQALQNENFTPLSIPLLAIEVGVDKTCFYHAIRDSLARNLAPRLIVTSANTLSAFEQCDAAIKKQLINWPCFAIGKATQQALLAYGFKQVCCADSDTSEALLAKIKLGSTDQQTYWIIKGEGGRNTLLQGLKQLDHQVATFAVYKRCWLSISYQQAQAIAQQDAWLITSGEMLLHLQQELQNHGVSCRASTLIFVPSQRIVDIARQNQIENVINCQSALNSNMITVLKSLNKGFRGTN